MHPHGLTSNLGSLFQTLSGDGRDGSDNQLHQREESHEIHDVMLSVSIKREQSSL